ncbi:hypothetical protein [Clostridium botulinum]|uniref:hypothetical protein n=1 Tax=Clostridium botulinum TaxID=1491 RepID=UPI001749ADC3|nr:hypothetical protein [Clostridium botulinum]MBD5572384.1 hypothetical protein [Clostridium botulinum]
MPNEEYVIKDAERSRKYYFYRLRIKINHKISRACEAGERSIDVSLLPNNIQKELEDIGYEIINTEQNTIIQW